MAEETQSPVITEDEKTANNEAPAAAQPAGQSDEFAAYRDPETGRIRIPIYAQPSKAAEAAGSELEIVSDQPTAETKEKPVIDQLATPEGLARAAAALAGDVGLRTRLRKLPVAEAASRDIMRQTAPRTLEDKVTEAAGAGTTTIAGVEYDQEELNFMMQGESSRAALQEELDFFENTEEALSPVGKVPFRRDGKFYNVEDADDANLTTAKEKTSKYLQDIDLMLRDQIPEPDLRALVVKNYGRGVIDVTQEKLAEIGRGTVVGVPYLAGLSRHAVPAFFDSVSRGTSFFDELAARGPEMEGWFNSVDNFFESFNYEADVPFTDGRQKMNIGFGGITMGRAMNDSIRLLMINAVKDGEMTQERFDELNFVIDETTDEIVPREFVTDQDAQDLMNLAYDDLNVLGKIIATGADVGAGYMSWSRRQARSAAYTRQDVQDKYTQMADAAEIPAAKRATNIFDMARALEDNIETVSINRKLLNLGIYQEKVSNRVDQLQTTAAEARARFKQVELNVDPGGAARLGFRDGLPFMQPRAPLQWRRAKAAVDNAEAAYLRAKLGSVVDPIMMDGAKTWALTTTAQYAGREILAGGEDGMDPQLAEFMSATFAYTMGMPIARGFTRTVRGLATETLTIPGATRDPRWFARTADFLIFGRGGILADRTITDYEKLVFEPKENRKMTSSEKEGLRQIVRMYKNSSQDARDRFFEDAKAYVELVDNTMKYVRSSVRPDQAIEIENNIHTAFYQIGSMTRLAALGKDAMGNLNLDELGRRPALDDLENYMSNKATRFSEEAIAALIESFRVNGVSGPQMDSLIAMMNGGVRRFNETRAEDAAQLGEYLQEAVSTYGTRATDNIGPNLIENISALNKSVAESLGQEFDAVADLTRVADQITENIGIRSRDLMNMDKGVDYIAAVSRGLDDLVDTRDAIMHSRSRQIYAPVRSYFEKNGKSIDMSEFVDEFVVAAGAEGSIARFFSPQGAFFSSAEGRKVARTFEDMVNRVYGKEAIKELRKVLIDGGVPQEEVEYLSNLQVALRAEKAGAKKVFEAVNGEELDLMIRQMKKYAVKTNNESLGAVASEIAEKLDTMLMRQDKDGFDVLEVARKTYRTERGDRTRKGGFTDAIISQREGPPNLAKSSTDMSNYAIPINKLSSLEWIDENVVPDLLNVMKQDVDSKAFIRSRNRLRKFVRNLETEFGIRGGPDGRSYFDLDSADAKKMGNFKMFVALQGALTNALAGTYGVGEARKLEQALTRGQRVGATTFQEATAPFDFTRLRNVLDVDEIVHVKVKQGDRFYDLPLVLMDDVLESGYSLEGLYKQNESIRKTYDEGLERVKTFASSEAARAQREVRSLEQTAFEQLERVMPRITNANDVYNSVIMSKGVNVDDLLGEMADALRQADPKYSNSADEMAKSLLRQMLVEGLLNRADVRPLSGEQLIQFDPTTGKRETIIPRVANSPETPVQDINDNFDKFVEVFGQKHAEGLRYVFTYMNQMNRRTEGVSGNRSSAANIRQFLSKAYNIARGQVGVPYAVGDVGLRLMEDARIDMYKLMATNEDAALLSAQLLQNMPISQTEVERLGNHFLLYAITEMNALGMDVSYHVERVEQDIKRNTELDRERYADFAPFAGVSQEDFNKQQREKSE